MIDRPNGIVLVTGPTGSGKTTTLYSTLKHLARPEINVCTVEDPIEMVSPEFNQMQVQPAIDLDFAAGVRTLLRQDPDIIMVGEIRDLETAQMAVQASLTGHLVLSTLHTNDAPSAVTRLLDLGVPHYLIQSTLAGVVAQRLVRTLCPHCKAEARQDPDCLGRADPRLRPAAARARLRTGRLPGMPQDRLPRPHRRLRDAAHESAPARPARPAARPGRSACASPASEGMRPLRVSAATQVARGLTTVEEVLAVLPPEDAAPVSNTAAS